MSVETQLNEQTESEEGAGASEQSSGLQRLGELLSMDEQPSEEPGGDQGESSGSQSEESEETKPTKFNDLAGVSGLDLDALYGLEVQLEGVDEGVTIEQLKDHFKSAKDFDLQVLEFEERRTEEQNALARTQAELREILQALPANAVKPEVLAKIRERTQQAAETERAATLDAIPEWKSDERRQSDIAAMTEHLQGYGFPVNQLEHLIDHRWQRYIRDNMLRERRVKEALAKVRPAKPDKSGKTPPQKKAAQKGATSITPRAGQSRLEAALLNSD